MEDKLLVRRYVLIIRYFLALHDILLVHMITMYMNLAIFTRILKISSLNCEHKVLLLLLVFKS